MHDHLQQEAQVITQNKMAISNNRSIGGDESDSDSQDSESSSRNNTNPRLKSEEQETHCGLQISK
jgi:hypothetical protein